MLKIVVSFSLGTLKPIPTVEFILLVSRGQCRVLSANVTFRSKKKLRGRFAGCPVEEAGDQENLL